MAGFTRQSLLAWLARHRGRAIALKARGSSLSLTGVCEGVEELDACNTEFTACLVRLSAPYAELSLTLHDTALALHLLLRDPERGRTMLSLPITISYADLILAPAAAERREPGQARRRGKQKDPALSNPYRLLH
jgi:hypothetical protein